MKKEARLVYLELSSEIKGTLCTFCHYSSWQGDGCSEGYNECHHPIEALSWENTNEDTLEPGSDCYGFRPNLPIHLVTEIAGAILSQGFDEWMYRRFSPTSVTVYGRHWQQGKENAATVRIG